LGDKFDPSLSFVLPGLEFGAQATLLLFGFGGKGGKKKKGKEKKNVLTTCSPWIGETLKDPLS
jgi:hypothetical protein